MQVKAGKTSFEYTPARPYAQEAFDTDLAAPLDLGNIVFCQSLTFSATTNPIIYENAAPVFIASNYETWIRMRLKRHLRNILMFMRFVRLIYMA